MFVSFSDGRLLPYFAFFTGSNLQREKKMGDFLDFIIVYISISI